MPPAYLSDTKTRSKLSSALQRNTCLEHCERFRYSATLPRYDLRLGWIRIVLKIPTASRARAQSIPISLVQIAPTLAHPRTAPPARPQSIGTSRMPLTPWMRISGRFGVVSGFRILVCYPLDKKARLGVQGSHEESCHTADNVEAGTGWCHLQAISRGMWS